MRAYPAHRRSNGRHETSYSTMPVRLHSSMFVQGARNHGWSNSLYSDSGNTTNTCHAEHNCTVSISWQRENTWSDGTGGSRSGAAPCAAATSAGNPNTSKAHCAQRCAPAFCRRCRGRLTALRRSPLQRQTPCKAEKQTPHCCSTAWRPLDHETRRFPATELSTEEMQYN